MKENQSPDDANPELNTPIFHLLDGVLGKWAFLPNIRINVKWRFEKVGISASILGLNKSCFL